MAARKNGDKRIHDAHIPSLGIHNFQFVTGITNVHLVACVMLHMADCSCRECVALEVSAKCGALVAAGMTLDVLLVEGLHCHALSLDAGCILWQQGLKLLLAGRRLLAVLDTGAEHLLKMVLRDGL